MLLVIPAVFLGLGYLVYGRSARSVSTFEDKQLIVERIIDHPVESIQTIWSQDDAAMSDYFSCNGGKYSKAVSTTATVA